MIWAISRQNGKAHTGVSSIFGNDGLRSWSLFYFFIDFFIFYFFLLYNIGLVLPYINMNPPWVYTCSPSWTPRPPLSRSYPSGSSQCTSPEHPVSCIEPGLAIRFTYDIIYVSMPFSQITPPSHSPTESTRLFYTSVSLLTIFLIIAFVLLTHNL